MLGVYRKFQEDWMAMPVITGRKTESEKFAGALRTYALEALMQDKKALQAGTSHNLGQNFAKAFNLQYQTAAGGLEYAWNTSWGVSTRMIGGLVMTHSDDNGLVCPSRLAPVQVAIVPIWKSEEERDQVSGVGDQVKTELEKAGFRVELDLRDNVKPGAKYFEWEAKRVPLPGDAEDLHVVRQAQRRRGGVGAGVLGFDPALLRGIAERVGTPAYVYSANLMRAQYHALHDALKDVPHRICYSVKANGNVGVLKVLKALGAGADIVSVGELRCAPSPCTWVRRSQMSSRTTAVR